MYAEVLYIQKIFEINRILVSLDGKWKDVFKEHFWWKGGISSKHINMFTTVSDSALHAWKQPGEISITQKYIKKPNIY